MTPKSWPVTTLSILFVAISFLSAAASGLPTAGFELLTATHCNTMQHTATHCNTRNTLQLTVTHATHCNTLQHTASHVAHRNPLQYIAILLRQVKDVPHTTHVQHQHTATRCNTAAASKRRTVCPSYILQHTATHCYTLPHTAKHCNALLHTATYCNTLQHLATSCSTL